MPVTFFEPQYQTGILIPEVKVTTCFSIQKQLIHLILELFCPLDQLLIETRFVSVQQSSYEVGIIVSKTFHERGPESGR